MMRYILERWIGLLAALALVMAPATSIAAEKRLKPAKTEMDKAVGKCFATVLGGALLGALFAGKKDRGKGAAIGAGVGAAACALLVASAKRQDRLLALQREAVTSGRMQTANYYDADGRSVEAMAVPRAADNVGAVRPVTFTMDGEKITSPDLGEAPKICRYASSELSAAEGNAKISPQLWCRGAESTDWYPYSTDTI